VYYGSGDIDTVEVRNNIVYDCDNGTVVYYFDVGNIDFLIESDYDTSDPLFVGGSPYSYELQAGSPAIDGGIDVGLLTDYEGNLIESIPDIGAYEYNGNPPAPAGTVFSKKGTKFLKHGNKLMKLN